VEELGEGGERKGGREGGSISNDERNHEELERDEVC
jgi:hypothetical protein